MPKVIPQYEPVIQQDYIQATLNQMQSGWIGPGKTTEEFERLLAQKCERKYAVCVNSGTSALMLAISIISPTNRTLGVLRNIIVPSYGYVAAANAGAYLGYNIIPAEVSQDTLCIEPNGLAKLLHKHPYSSVIYINHNGYFGEEFKQVVNLCYASQTMIISDAAVGLGCLDAAKYGHCATLSFSVPKIITTGQGGCLLTNDDALYKEAKQLRDQGDGWRQDRNHRHIGINLRLPDLLSSFGIPQIKQLDKLIKQRNKIWKWYRKYLIPGLLIDIYGKSGWCVIIRSSLSVSIHQNLQENNIKSSFYYRALHNNSAFNHLKSYHNLEVAETLSRELLYLPSSLSLTKDNVKKICQTINQTVR